ncbi:cation:proton antiporter [Sulfurimonas sp. MAG313]|nr:cation:proton antiporter [Sulfurimonas sp. MAG313]MDF1880534.1 cation:proton antiporter [Sulfurimonas sp. MAG313]
MSTVLIAIISILLLSRILQRLMSIPLPIGIMSLTLITYTLIPEHINISAGENFDSIVYLLLPLILLPDAINFKLSDLKKHGIAIFYLSFVSVILSIIIGIALNYTGFVEYSFTVGMLICLFAMVLATDAVSVSSIFSQFKLPHSLKILTEGESLFNDATAVIAFFFVGLPLINGIEITPISVSLVLVKVVVVSSLIGFMVGYAAKSVLKWLHTVTDEFIIVILTAYLSFGIAELHAIHVSGILSLIVAVMTLRFYINKQVKSFSNEESIIYDEALKVPTSKADKIITTQARLDENLQIISFFALFANAVLFFTLAEIIEFEKMMTYSKEIITLFLVTTIIRALMMLKFSFISKASSKIQNVNYRWWSILTFAGIKGGLSMIMVHALPDTFIYKEMFTQVVMGVILLSIFVYAFSLLFIIKRYEKDFLEDIKQETH